LLRYVGKGVVGSVEGEEYEEKKLRSATEGRR
jgi:hypothetical protein